MQKENYVFEKQYNPDCFRVITFEDGQHTVQHQHEAVFKFETLKRRIEKIEDTSNKDFSFEGSAEPNRLHNEMISREFLIYFPHIDSDKEISSTANN